MGVGKGKGVMEEKNDITTPTKNANPYTKPSGIKCYRCKEMGRHSNECPKRTAIDMVEREDNESDDEVCGPDGDDNGCDYNDHDEYACVVRKFILSPKSADDTQFHKLFQTRCPVQREFV